VGKRICGTDFSVDITLTWGAGAYIVGEETALIESLEGERGMPRLKPPFFPASKGLYMQPTIVNNVETLSNLPYIVNQGGTSFKDLGGATSSGMRIFAVSGHVNKPGVFEVPNGITTFRMLFEAPEYCGGVRANRKVKAFIPGGASAMWFFDEHLDLPLDKPTVDQAGSMLGSGAIVVMDETTDMVKACWRVVRFFARESCGKCTPCREGTTWLERILHRILTGNGRREDLDLLFEVSESISPGLAWPPRQTTICPLGPSAVSPIASAVNRFRNEFEHYIEHGRAIAGVEYVPMHAGSSHGAHAHV
jgi:NADH-quinone oxidoreductase subunit F